MRQHWNKRLSPTQSEENALCELLDIASMLVSLLLFANRIHLIFFSHNKMDNQQTFVRRANNWKIDRKLLVQIFYYHFRLMFMWRIGKMLKNHCWWHWFVILLTAVTTFLLWQRKLYSVHLNFCLTVCLFVRLSACLLSTTRLSVCVPTCLFVFVCVCLWLSFCLAGWLPACMCVYLSVCLLVNLFCRSNWTNGNQEIFVCLPQSVTGNQN